MLYIILAIFTFILGAIIGSFLNVLILRYNNRFFQHKRSECFSCGETLSFNDLMPILSFFLLRGRCRYCRSKISVQYPIVEFLSGLAFLFVYLKIGTINLHLVLYWIIWAILIAIFVYDLKHKIIPNGLVYTLIALSLLRVIWIFYPYFGFGDFLWLISAGPLASLPFALLCLVSGGRWMGLGDAKLSLALGWLLGIFDAISAITFAFWIGAVTGIILVLLSKLSPFSWSQKFKNLTIKSEIPFAPFLVIGMAIVFFLGYDLSIFF